VTWIAIARHELAGYLRAPVAWGIGVLFLAVQGVGFAGQVAALSDPERPAPLGAVLDGFFAGSLLTWSLGLAVIALIAMRAIAEDRRAGTWETLLTAPVGEGEVIVGKWIAGAAFHAILWLPTAAYLIVVAVYRPPGAGWDLGPVVTAYAGVIAIGAALLAVAMAAAAWSPSPLVAGAAAYAVLMLVLLVGELPSLWPGLAVDHPDLSSAIGAASVRGRMSELARGEVTGGAVVLVAGLVVVGLSLAITGACLGRRRDVAARGVATVLVAVIAIQAGALIARWPLAWDVTSRGHNSLDPETRATLARLSDPAKLTVIRPTLDELEPVFDEAVRVARRFAVAQPRIAVAVVDPASIPGGLPAVARDAGLADDDLATSGAIVVDVGGRRRVVDVVDAGDLPGFTARDPSAPPPRITQFAIEAELAARLRELDDDRPLVACATTGHGELGFAPDPAVAELSSIAARVRADGGRIEPIADELAAGVPEHCRVVIVAGPTTPLPGAYALAIERWLDAGGGLLVMSAVRPGGGGEMPPTGLEPILSRNGIDVLDAVALDPTIAVEQAMRVGTTYGNHPVVAGFNGRRFTIWLAPRALAIRAPALPLAMTTSNGWAETQWKAPPYRFDAGDDIGPVAIAAAAERGGRLVVIGSAESLSSAVTAGAGDLLAAQAIRWLARRDRVEIATRDKTPEQLRLLMTTAERRAVIAMCAGGVPLVIAAMGIAITLRRRRKLAAEASR
jgi:ABC-2 type transport system permease protein